MGKAKTKAKAKARGKTKAKGQYKAKARVKAKAKAEVRAWMGWENCTTSPIKMTMYENFTNMAPIKTTSLKFFGGVVIKKVAMS